MYNFRLHSMMMECYFTHFSTKNLNLLTFKKKFTWVGIYKTNIYDSPGLLCDLSDGLTATADDSTHHVWLN